MNTYKRHRFPQISFPTLPCFELGAAPQDDLDAQTTGELFYRLQLSENLAITPNVQLLKDPALNDQDDIVWVTGIRLRLTL